MKKQLRDFENQQKIGDQGDRLQKEQELQDHMKKEAEDSKYKKLNYRQYLDEQMRM